MIQIVLLMLLGVIMPLCVHAEDIETVEPIDTSVVTLHEITIISTPKETGSMRQQPSSVSLLDEQQMRDQKVTSLKNLSSLVPNFFIPEYGSRLTSAVYIRGIGSRINTPAVGLYVDNMPYVDKSAFDTTTAPLSLAAMYSTPVPTYGASVVNNGNA